MFPSHKHYEQGRKIHYIERTLYTHKYPCNYMSDIFISWNCYVSSTVSLWCTLRLNCRFNDQLLSPKFEKARNGHLHLLQLSVGACLTIYQQKFYRFDKISTRIWIMILIIIIISIWVEVVFVLELNYLLVLDSDRYIYILWFKVQWPKIAWRRQSHAYNQLYVCSKNMRNQFK